MSQFSVLMARISIAMKYENNHSTKISIIANETIYRYENTGISHFRYDKYIIPEVSEHEPFNTCLNTMAIIVSEAILRKWTVKKLTMCGNVNGTDKRRINVIVIEQLRGLQNNRALISGP